MYRVNQNQGGFKKYSLVYSITHTVSGYEHKVYLIYTGNEK